VLSLKRESGRGILTGGVTLPRALAEWGLIDEYECIVHPRVAGGGRTLFAGLSRALDLHLVAREELPSGAVALQYRLASCSRGGPGPAERGRAWRASARSARHPVSTMGRDRRQSGSDRDDALQGARPSSISGRSNGPDVSSSSPLAGVRW